MSSYSLSSYLLSLHKDQFTRATQSSFLRLAASGTLPKDTISHWLASDRLYMRGYIHLAGELLRILTLPDKPVPSKATEPVQIRLLDWLVDALVNIRREERFFIEVAERYELDVDLTQGEGEVAVEEKKLEGLKRFEKLFSSLTTGQTSTSFLPWLEGVVVFWATEKVYFTAWSWAKEQASAVTSTEDQDGGAMRTEFIPKWTNDEFIAFVDTLERILDEGVREAVGSDADKKREVEARAGSVWKELLDAEEAFWPRIE